MLKTNIEVQADTVKSYDKQIGVLCIVLSCVILTIEPVHEISNNVVCATSKVSDQPAHMRSLIRAIASRLSIL